MTAVATRTKEADTRLPDVFRRVCEKNGWLWEGRNAQILLPGGRNQLIFMDLFKYEDEEMVRFSTNVGCKKALTQPRLEAALSINSWIAHGALAIREDNLVMTDTFLLREADQDEVESSIRYIAKLADHYESKIYGTDQN